MCLLVVAFAACANATFGPFALGGDSGSSSGGSSGGDLSSKIKLVKV